MPFQSAVNINLAFGIPGEFKFDGPQRAEVGVVNSQGSLTSALNYAGYGYTRDVSTGLYQVGGQVGNGACSVTASIATNVLTVTAVGSGVVTNGLVLSGTNVTAGTVVLRQLTGAAGGIGTYLLDRNSTAGSTTVTGAGNGQMFGGILLHPKNYAAVGTAAGGTLAPTLAIPDNYNGEFGTMGIIVVNVTGAANIGDQVQFNSNTGALSCVAPGASATSGNTLIAGAAVWRYPTAATGLIAIKLG